MKIHLITNCTNSKSSKLKHDVKIKDISDDYRYPSKNWLTTLQKQTDLSSAIDVYVGDHWSKVSELYNLDFPVWVVSAGYGLISAKQKIGSYNATFNANNENSVSRFFEEGSLTDKNIKWWNEINLWEGSHTNYIGPIKRLFNENPSDVFFIVVPPNYLKVLEPELQKLFINGTINTENTFIFSSKLGIKPSLEPLFFQAKDDFCQDLGGSRISLNIRLASHILRSVSPEGAVAPQVNKLYNELLANALPAQRFNRNKMNDENITNFIKDEVLNIGLKGASASKLLRILRDKGMACEQKRFARLYKEFIKKQLEQETIGSI